MEFEGHTGCLDFEKTDGQKFIVSLDIFIDRIRGPEVLMFAHSQCSKNMGFDSEYINKC